MWLSTRENRGLTEEEGMWNEIWQHQQIYTILLRHQILNTKVSKSGPFKEKALVQQKWKKSTLWKRRKGSLKLVSSF